VPTNAVSVIDDRGPGPGPTVALARPVPSLVIDTGDYPEAERERMFLHVRSLALLTDILARPAHCRLQLYELGDMRLAIAAASAWRGARLPETIALDRRSSIDVVLVREGAIRGEVDGRHVSLGAGEALVTDFCRPFRLEHAANETIALTLERRLIARDLPWLEDLNGCVVRGAPARLLADHLQRLAAQLPSTPAAAALDEVRQTIAVLAACLPSSPQAGFSPRVLADDLRVLERATLFIESHLDRADLEPSAIWKAAHVSRSRLYRVFAALGGVSRYIAQRRLARAHAALTHPGEARTIARIAHDCGFANVSHFARSFRDAFGLTARQVRQGAGAAVPPEWPSLDEEARSWSSGATTDGDRPR
jgi:AraC-like DNA-binding protein